MTLVDWDRLEALREDIGEEDFADVACVFVSEIDAKLEALAASGTTVTADDFHFLKGSAANLGFVAMARACEAAEVACRNGTPPALDAVTLGFMQALDELRPRLPELGAA